MSLVIILSIGKVFVKVIHSGDIAVSARTLDTLMTTSSDPNAAFMSHAFPDSTV